MKPNETGRFIPGRLRLSRRSARLLSLVSLAAALALELTPWGVVLSFFAGPDRTFLSTCSFFSLLPFGYGNWFPLIAGWLTVLALFGQLWTVLRAGRTRRLPGAVLVCTLLAAAAALVQALLSAGSAAAAGWTVPLLLLLSAVFQAFANRQPS